MPNPKEIDVKVLVTKDETKPAGVWFELQSNLVSNGELTFKNDKHPGFVINFNIDDPLKTGCLFQANEKDAMWVQTFEPGTADPCPRSPLYWDQFEATNVKKGDTQLVVRNINEFEQMFAFSLRFRKPGWPDPILFDPIGDNKNGPPAIASSALIVGLVVFGLAAVAAFAFLDG